MIIVVNRFDFAKGVVMTHQRVIPDRPPSTPLMDMLIAKAPKNALGRGKRK